jgi:hypothetical protein
LSTPPRKPQRSRTPAPATGSAPLAAIGKTPTLSERLPGMTDQQLRTYQAVAGRISRDPDNARHAAANRAVPKIEAEIRRRADLLETP